MIETRKYFYIINLKKTDEHQNPLPYWGKN